MFLKCMSSQNGFLGLGIVSKDYKFYGFLLPGFPSLPVLLTIVSPEGTSSTGTQTEM